MRKFLHKRNAILLTTILAVILIASFATHMEAAIQDTATVTLTVPSVLTIEDLDTFALTISGGTATGSEIFTVTTNNPTGVEVTGSCSSFIPDLGDTTVAVIMTNAISSNAGAITPTASLSVDIANDDESGARTATLTITATDKP